MLKGQARSLGQIDDNASRYTTADLTLNFATTDDCIYAEENARIVFSMVNNEEKFYDMLTPNGLCSIKVNGSIYSVDGKNVIIKADLESNLRVNKGSNRLLLKGVQSA